MSIEIQMFNADAAAARFDGMIHQIARFGNPGIAHFIREWQSEDLDRKHPFLTGKSPHWSGGHVSAQTTVRPHSRYEVQHSKAFQARLGRRLRGKKHPRLIPAVQRLRWSTRPILRAGLWEQLVERITKAFNAEISWARKK